MADDCRTGADSAQPPERVDVVVVGAGQAGLAIGHYLRPAGRSFRFSKLASPLARHGAGAGTRSCCSPRVSSMGSRPWRSQAPGRLSQRAPRSAYLESYAATFKLPIEFSSPVSSLVRAEEGLHSRCSRAVDLSRTCSVVATGPFQRPSIPPVASQLSQALEQMHSVDYRRPDDIADGEFCCRRRKHGFQIAKELSATRPVPVGRLAAVAVPTARSSAATSSGG